MEDSYTRNYNKNKSKLLPKRKYFKINIKRYLLETSLNGLKYVYDRERNLWERSYYLISFIILLLSGCYMSYYFLRKWQSSPVIISLSSETTSIQDIPFPTVTFCNMNQALRSKVATIERDTPEHALVQKMCFQSYNFSRFRNFTPRFEGDTFANFIVKHAPTCGTMMVYCKFGPFEEKCSDLFREVLLDDGLCCVFNHMHPFFLYKGEDKMEYPTILTKKPTKSKLLPLNKYFAINIKRFLLETCLNGLKYVYDKERNIWERGYYLISFVIAFFCGLYMAVYFLEKWRSTPVIISLSSETTSIQDIPFPTVVFCNMNQALRGKVNHFPKDSPEKALLQKICFQDYNFTRFHKFKARFEGDTFSNFIVNNAQSCEDMIIYCKFGTREEKCTDLFREILLDEGLCCVFNQMHPFFLFKGEYKFIRDYTSSNGRTTIPVNWNIENGYKKPLPKNFYPRPAAGSGMSMGLTVLLNADISEYYCSSTNGAGFKMLLSNSIDAPNIKEIGVPIALGQQTTVRIKTKRTSSMESLRKISVTDRQCYFSNERPLQYYKYYTRKNCEMECDSQLMLRFCQCIPYYMAMIQANASVCFLKDMNCVVLAESLILDPQTQSCKEQCFSGCNELSYYPSLFATPFAKRDYNLQAKFMQNMSIALMEEDLAQVQFYYKENVFRGNTKDPYTGFTEFVSQTGGILSLMVGFSVIALAEAFYFTLMKSFFDIWLRRSPQKLTKLDDIEESVMNTKKDTFLDKKHHRMLIKCRKPIHNRVMVWNKDDLKKYQEKN